MQLFLSSWEQPWTFLHGTTWFRGESVLESNNSAHFNTERRAPQPVSQENGWQETQEMQASPGQRASAARKMK